MNTPTLHRDYRGTTRVNSKPHPKPNRLAVLRDDRRGRSGQLVKGYSIVTTKPVHPKHGLVGYKRGYGERHGGLYAYRFYSWGTATRVAIEISTHAVIFEGQDDGRSN